MGWVRHHHRHRHHHNHSRHHSRHTHFLSLSPSRQRPARPGSRRGNEWWPQYASPPRTGPLNKQELFSGLTHAAPPPVEDAELVQAESFCLKIAPRGRYYFMFERRAGRVRVGEDTSFCNLCEHPLGRPLSSRPLPTFVCLGFTMDGHSSLILEGCAMKVRKRQEGEMLCLVDICVWKRYMGSGWGPGGEAYRRVT